MRARDKLPGVIAAITALALALVAPGAASASNHQEMILQDDQELIYSPSAHVAQTLKTLRDMGVDRVRVSVVWSLVAPKPNASRKPKFKATNPAAYPGGAWFRYDFIDRVAGQLGIKVYFQPTAPAPTWATTPRKLPQGYRWSHNPSAKAYGQFVQAIATRYSGSYMVPDFNGGSSALPRVSYWGTWNEPNIGGWMTPQWNTVKGRKVEASPAIDRSLVNAAWSALGRSGHGHDTIVIGETAAYGAGHKGYGASMDPLTFTRAFYCVGSSYKPLRGAAAARVGCPKSGNRGAFVRKNRALFAATGWAHHPYDFVNPPSHHRRDPNSATLSNITRIEKALDRAQRAYHKQVRFPIYVTEWGIQSRGPSPFVKFSQAQQAQYINEGEYMAYKNPRIPAFAQFLLVDSGPNKRFNPGRKAYWATFQSGLLFYPSQQPKPAFDAFELPIWLPHPHHGPRVTVWAQIRPTTAARTGTLQFQPRGSSTWTNVASVSAADAEGFLTTTVSLPSAGGLRLAWAGPANTPVYSRTANVS
jgi:hypothetical protein